MSEPGTDLVLPATGEIVDLSDPQAVVKAYREVQRLQGELAGARRELAAALVGYSQRVGERTVTLPTGERFVREGGPRRQYRPDDVEAGLRAAGMPEERIAQIVVVEVSRTVKAAEAGKAARANPEYAAVLESASQMVEAPFTVKLG